MQEGLVFMAKTNCALPPYSVLMAVYVKDIPEWYALAVESMANQTHRPDEIIIVNDGPLTPALLQTQQELTERYGDLIRIIALEKNGGLAEAMRLAVNASRCQWMARMDADDISDLQRCEKELQLALEKNADIVGCDSEEFIGTVDNPKSRRIFPASHEELVAFSRRKVPFCHPAVMMKKSAVLRAGNYHNVFPHDDYDLFVRMLATGSIGCTVKEILFHVRVNEDFYKRRGGLKYLVTLLDYNLQLLKSGWMRPSDFVMRSGGNILFALAPVRLRTWLYRRLLRK